VLCICFLNFDNRQWSSEHTRRLPNNRQRPSGRAIAETVSFWIRTAAALFWSQVMRDLRGTKWYWGRFSPKTLVSPANSHSIDCSNFINNLIILGTLSRQRQKSLPPEFIIIIIIALQLLFGLGLFFNFLILYRVSRTPSTGDQPVARSLPTHATTRIENNRTKTPMPWMRFEPRIPAFERPKTMP
jgi:hypothetical protein